jgi:hypothetical protein
MSALIMDISEQNAASPQETMPTVQISSDMVYLQVGNRMFPTTVSKLRQYPTTLLGAMFAEENTSLLKPSLIYGEIGAMQYHIYKFDRDPRVFEFIWQFYEKDNVDLQGFANLVGKSWRNWALV